MLTVLNLHVALYNQISNKIHNNQAYWKHTVSFAIATVTTDAVTRAKRKEENDLPKKILKNP